MDIIFHGQPSIDEASQQIKRVLHGLVKRYKIAQLREIHLSVTLVDAQGFDVELVDQKTNQTYRVIDVYESCTKPRPLGSGIIFPPRPLADASKTNPLADTTQHKVPLADARGSDVHCSDRSDAARTISPDIFAVMVEGLSLRSEFISGADDSPAGGSSNINAE